MENIQPGRQQPSGKSRESRMTDGASAKERMDRYFSLGKQGANPIKEKGEATPRVRELLERLVEKQSLEEKKKETKDLSAERKWPMPFKWKRNIQSGSKRPDMVVIFYLNIKGEMENPQVIPLYSGNMVIFRNKVYEVDPRAFWTVKTGFNKMYKVLIIKEIDRRPVSNLDWDEIRRRGDATDSDEFLIKAALRAQIRETAVKAGKWVIALIILAIVGLLIWFFTKG